MALKKSRSLRNLQPSMQLGQPEFQSPAVLQESPEPSMQTLTSDRLFSYSPKDVGSPPAPGTGSQGQAASEAATYPAGEREHLMEPMKQAPPTAKPEAPQVPPLSTKPGSVTNEVTPEELRRRKLINPQGKLSPKF